MSFSYLFTSKQPFRFELNQQQEHHADTHILKRRVHVDACEGISQPHNKSSKEGARYASKTSHYNGDESEQLEIGSHIGINVVACK